MVRLPEVIGCLGLKAIEQVKLFSIGFRSFMCQNDQTGIKRINDRRDLAITGNRLALLFRHLHHFSMDSGTSAPRLLKSQSFDSLSDAPLSCVNSTSAIAIFYHSTLPTSSSFKGSIGEMGQIIPQIQRHLIFGITAKVKYML